LVCTKRFYETIETQNITAGDYSPITVLITCAKGANAKEAKLLSYHNSGDTTGDYSSVVGYAAINFKK
jgi:AmmeMemoRadiSam system protein B